MSGNRRDYRRIAALSVVLLLELVALWVTRDRGTSESQRALERLYELPEPLQPAAPGTPIRVWRVGAPDVDGLVYGMLYHSVSEAGKDIYVSGYLAIPARPAPDENGYPLVAIGHGTVGGADRCAPSRNPQTEAAILNPLLKRGWLVVATDYEGIGGSGRHPYLVGNSEARSMLDSVRAARILAEGSGRVVSNRFVAWGISQGGHAALFVRQIAKQWAPELELVGAVALAPVSDVAGFVSDPPIAPAAITLLSVAGYTAAYGDLSASDVLSDDGMDSLEQVDERCLADLSKKVSKDSLDQLRQSAPLDVPAWRDALSANSPGATPSNVPLLLVQGTRDPIVLPTQTKALHGRLCKQKAVAQLDLVPGASHGDVATLGQDRYLPWMADRFASSKPRSGC